MFYFIAVLFLFSIGGYLMMLTPEKVEKMNEKIQDPSKKKSIDTMRKQGKFMIIGGVLFAVLWFV